jgi:tRNA A-37 threonylcarbamoyl transferase component Bud32
LVYEKDGIIYKQTSLDLAHREARFLSQLEGDYFPKLLSVQTEEHYSVLTLRKTEGRTLRDALPEINSSVESLYYFIQHCLSILLELENKGITHRNICRENLSVQEDKPVLHDFAWATSQQEPYFSPTGLGGYERPPDGRFSDVYSMGKILEYVNRQHYRAFDWIISLMTMADMRLRVTDPGALKVLFTTALKVTLEDPEEQLNYA